MRTHRLGSVLLLVLALVAGACSDGPTDARARVAGTYELQDVNGSSLPATIAVAPEGRLEITSGTMVLRADESYTETVRLRIIFNDGQTETESFIENGTYSMTGGTITFTVPPSLGEEGFSYTGEVSGRTLTYTAQGLTATYRRS
ncbi:MAG TPA: hypothetical protein VGR37_07950 [Longimicrobiaceae bacterium]|nr:hypothetical protein [Longimicrobiaceae bacterium]